MKDVRDIISNWKSIAAFAESVDVPYERACQWKKRNSLPPEYWGEVIKAASKEGISGVTLEALLNMRTGEAA
jgi:formyltetrahydrofolate hydrolase